MRSANLFHPRSHPNSLAPRLLAEEVPWSLLFKYSQTMHILSDLKSSRARRFPSASEFRALRLSRLVKYASWFFLKSQDESALRVLTALSALRAARWRELELDMVL